MSIRFLLDFEWKAMTKEMNADDFMQEFDESVDDVMKKYRQEINNIYEAESKEVKWKAY